MLGDLISVVQFFNKINTLYIIITGMCGQIKTALSKTFTQQANDKS